MTGYEKHVRNSFGDTSVYDLYLFRKTITYILQLCTATFSCSLSFSNQALLSHSRIREPDPTFKKNNLPKRKITWNDSWILINKLLSNTENKVQKCHRCSSACCLIFYLSKLVSGIKYWTVMGAGLIYWFFKINLLH